VAWDPTAGMVWVVYPEGAIDVLVSQALGSTQSTADTKGVSRNPVTGDLLFCVQSPSAHHGSVFSDADAGSLHVAEAETAHEALEERLRAYAMRSSEPLAGLCFRSAGRTPSFYGSPDHESRVVRDLVGPSSLGGCFCNGEIAPLDGLMYVHGFTSAIVTFRPR